MPNDPRLIGSVEDVQGATVGVLLGKDTATGLALVEGQGYRVGQVGNFVRVAIGYTDLFGIVTKVGAGAVPEHLAAVEPYGRRWMTVELVGESDEAGEFRRGLSQYPTIGDPVHLVTERDLARIYGRPEVPSLVAVGHLAGARSIPTYLDIDKLVTRHSAVLGTTGSGKSTTVANLLVSLTDPSRYPSSRVLVLDIHGEYAVALSDRASVFRANAAEYGNVSPLFIPYWALSFDELVSVGMGGVEDEKGRGAVLDKISELKRASLKQTLRPGVTADNLTVDSPVPFSIHRMWSELHCEIRATHYKDKMQGGQASQESWALALDDKQQPIQPGDVMKAVPPLFRAVKNVKDDPDKIQYGPGQGLNIGKAIDALGSRLRDPRFDFLFRPGPWLPREDGATEKDLDSLLEAWLGGEMPITILDLSGVPVVVAQELIGALLRLVYDALFWARNLPEGGRERPLLVVLEEAHAYLGQDHRGSAAQVVRRIAKEGRKYGVGAMIVSQRPAEVDSTILSQCGTFFAMRLTNQADRGHVTGAVSDHLTGLFDMLPALRTGEMLVVGEAVRLPVRTVVDPPPKRRRPDSCDPLVYGGRNTPGGWDRPRLQQDYGKVVEMWRSQNPSVKDVTRDPKSGG